jgi:hypothetical protein
MRRRSDGPAPTVARKREIYHHYIGTSPLIELVPVFEVAGGHGSIQAFARMLESERMIIDYER